MYFSIQIRLIFLLQGILNVIGETHTYSITRNISIDNLNSSSAYHIQKDGYSLSLCTNLCTADSACTSFMFDDADSKCYFYKEHLNVTSGDEVTSVTYIEKRQCIMVVVTPEANTEKCCYQAGELHCHSHKPSKIYTDCQDAFQQGERDTEGIYYLRPDPAWNIIRAVCQFDSTSGWTVIQKRVDDSVDFYRNWTSYVDGFGNLEDNYWIGLEAIYYLTRENRKLSIYLEDHDGETRTANYSTFYIEEASTEYVCHVSGYSGDAGDSLIHSISKNVNNMSFSTYDNDNDEKSTGNCASEYKGGWWYRDCHAANLNGIWYAGGNTPSSGTGAVWRTWKDYNYSLKTVYMRLSK